MTAPAGQENPVPTDLDGPDPTATSTGPDRAGPDPETDTDTDTVVIGTAPTGRTGRSAVLVPAAVGSLVAVALGVYGRLHEPTFFAIDLAGFSSGAAAKTWLATAAFLLALVQLGSSLLMYGRLGGLTAPSWTGTLHRWSGRLAVLATVPVALHCLYALGLQGFDTRVLAHSLLGCFFYGAFVAKMLLLERPGTPRWSLPVLGGLVFCALTGLWLTSSVWFFTTTGITF
jgi:hypothetical protein